LQKESRRSGRLDLPLEGEMSGRTEGGAKRWRTIGKSERESEWKSS
jgi:hypothetical protein